jgi:hypothetical protein
MEDRWIHPRGAKVDRGWELILWTGGLSVNLVHAATFVGDSSVNLFIFYPFFLPSKDKIYHNGVGEPYFDTIYAKRLLSYASLYGSF